MHYFHNARFGLCYNLVVYSILVRILAILIIHVKNNIFFTC